MGRLVQPAARASPALRIANDDFGPLCATRCLLCVFVSQVGSRKWRSISLDEPAAGLTDTRSARARRAPVARLHWFLVRRQTAHQARPPCSILVTPGPVSIDLSKVHLAAERQLLPAIVTQ